jgi:hypothetical protein
MKYSTFILILIIMVLSIKLYNKNKLIDILTENKIENTIGK